MEPDRLKSVICKICTASIDEKAEIPPDLEMIIASIRRAFQDYWQTEHLPLAARIAQIIDEGIPTPVLTVCGRGTQEIRFTRYLAYFLDSQKNHGLGALLLKNVLGEEARNFGLQDNWAEDCTVIPEYCLGNYSAKSGKEISCYSDIGIVGRDFLFVIEQKILSSEGPAGKTGLTQLKRYDKAIADNSDYRDKKIVKIFLTPSGREGEGLGDWFPMSHYCIIERAWRCLDSEGISKTARQNLHRLLIDLSLGPYKETEEIITEIRDAAISLTGETVSLQEIVQFRRLVGNNSRIVDLLLEVSP